MGAVRLVVQADGTQAFRARACGLDLAYVDCHMGISVASAYAGGIELVSVADL